MNVRVTCWQLHEGGATYLKGEAFETTAERGARLAELELVEIVSSPPAEPAAEVAEAKAAEGPAEHKAQLAPTRKKGKR